MRSSGSQRKSVRTKTLISWLLSLVITCSVPLGAERPPPRLPPTALPSLAPPARSPLHSLPFLSRWFFSSLESQGLFQPLLKRSVCLRCSRDPHRGFALTSFPTQQLVARPLLFHPCFEMGASPYKVSFQQVGTFLEFCGSASNLEFRGCVLEVLPFFSVAANPCTQVRFLAGAFICEVACTHALTWVWEWVGAHVCIFF